MARGEDCPPLYNFKLDTLDAKRAPPRITPNLIAETLPVNMKERNPPTERMVPAKPKNAQKKFKVSVYAIQLFQIMLS